MSTHSTDDTDESDDAPSTEQLAERLDELEAENERLREAIEEEADDAEEATDGISTTRRGALGGLAALAGVGALTGKSRAQTAAPGSACTWRGDQNAAGYNLLGLGAIGGGLTNDNTVENLAGTDLAIDSDGNLNVDAEAGGEAGLWTEQQDGEVTTAEGQGVDVPAVTTEEQRITKHHDHADWTVYKESSGNYVAIKGDSGGPEFDDPSFSTVMNSVEDNCVDGSHIHLTSRNVDGVREPFVSDGTVNIDKEIRISGEGNPQTRIVGEDGSSHDIFVFGENERVILGGLEWLRIDGNRANRSSGRNVVVKDLTEFFTTRCEIARSPEEGIHYNVPNPSSMHEHIHTWALANSGGDLVLDTNGGELGSFQWTGGWFRNSTEKSVTVPDGAFLTGPIQFDGVRFEGKGVYLRDGSNYQFDNCHWDLEDETIGIELDPVSSNDYQLHCTDGVFKGTNASPESAIKNNGGSNNVYIRNPFLKASGWTQQIVGDQGMFVTNAAGDWKTERQGTATVTSGNTSVTVDTGLTLDNLSFSLELVDVSPHSDLGAASYWYLTDGSGTQFNINLDVDPTQDVTFGWAAKARHEP